MPVRALAVAVLLTALAGCDLIGSDPGEFEATLTAADGSRATLQGSAVYDLQDGGATVLLLPRGQDLGSEIRVQIARAALAEGAATIGAAVSVAYIVRNGRLAVEIDPDNPPRPAEGGALVFEGTTGTVTLSRLTDDEAEGRIEAELAGSETPTTIRARFRATVP